MNTHLLIGIIFACLWFLLEVIPTKVYYNICRVVYDLEELPRNSRDLASDSHSFSVFSNITGILRVCSWGMVIGVGILMFTGWDHSSSPNVNNTVNIVLVYILGITLAFAELAFAACMGMLYCIMARKENHKICYGLPFTLWLVYKILYFIGFAITYPFINLIKKLIKKLIKYRPEQHVKVKRTKSEIINELYHNIDYNTHSDVAALINNLKLKRCLKK